MKKIIWLYGLSGAGKTSLAKALRNVWPQKQILFLDGDEVRKGPHADFGFTQDDRKEHLIRTAKWALFLSQQVDLVVCSFISPLREQRGEIHRLLGEQALWVFVQCSLEECAHRDPKGWYQKQSEGLVKNFTGKDSLFEPRDPVTENQHLVISTEGRTLEQSQAEFVSRVRSNCIHLG